MGPVEYGINERWVGAVEGKLEVTQAEIRTGLNDEGSFVALLSCRIKETADAMAQSVLDLVPTWDWPERPCES